MVESFHRSLFACTLDLVLYSYGTAPSCAFPWILDLFQLPAYIFMRVIEPIVRSEACLARSQLKYLKFVCCDSCLFSLNTLSTEHYMYEFNYVGASPVRLQYAYY